MRVGPLVCAVILAGCTGTIEPPTGSGGEDDRPDRRTERPDGPEGPGGRDPVPSTTVRRLSAHELARTIDVLTGVSPESLSLLPPESSELPIDRVVNAQTVCPAHLDAYLAIGAEVGATLLAERRLDDLADACADEILPPATTGTTTRVSGAGLGGGPDWAFAVDDADPTRTRVRYAPDPTVSYTHSFPAPGVYTLVLRADVEQGPVDVTEVWVGGDRIDAIADTDGPTEYTSSVEVTAAGPLVVEYRFLTDPDFHNLTILFEELTISGPEDAGAAAYADERRACIEALVDDFAPLAFRRPITDGERARFLSLFETGEEGGGWANGYRMVMQAILGSPSFLYLVEVGTPVDGSPGWFQLGPWEMAARLSYALCEEPPDAELRAAAASGELATPAQREAQARRLLESPCGRRAVRRFVEQWLHLDYLPKLNKSPEEFPEFTDEVRAALVADTARYVDEMLWTERADLRSLYTEPVAWPGAESEDEPAPGPRPGLKETFHDPTWRACVRRVTDVGGSFVNADTAHRNGYNADESRLLFQTNTHEFHVHDAETLGPVRSLGMHRDDSPQWHPTDPDLVRSIDGSDPFYVRETDVTTGTQTTLWDFTSAVKAVLPEAAEVYPPTIAEGRNASADGLRWALEVRSDTERLGYVLVDAESDSLLGYNMHSGAISSDRGVTVSPSGQYTLFIRCSSATHLYDEGFGFIRTIIPAACPYEWDFAYMADGREVFVYAHDGEMRAHVLASGEDFVVIPDLHFGASDQHAVSVRISGTAHDAPGWLALSFYKCETDFGASDCSTGYVWNQDRVVLMELGDATAGALRVLNLAWHRTALSGSVSVPYPSASRDLSRVLFVSSWNDGDGPVDLFEITVPPSAL